MATGVKPRDEDPQLTRADLDVIQDAMKNKKFREMLADYCEEVRDPANQELFQKEMTQLEKERGYDVTFINPKGGYVIKTSVAGDRKAFINICSNEKIGKPSCSVQEVNGQKGMNWQLPYTIIPPREDYDYKRERCVIYDVVFHPDTLRMAEVNKRFREIVNKTALDGLQKTYNIHLDSNNFRFPKSHYKGMTVPAVIRKEDPDYKPPPEDGTENISPEMMEKLYPQRNYSSENQLETPTPEQKTKRRNVKAEFAHTSMNGYTHPKYVIKQQKDVDMQEFTYDRDSKQHSAIPSHIVVEINLPLLSSTKDCELDVHEKSLSLKSEKPAKYKLEISLPYPVNDECGTAKFDKNKRKLIVTLPVIRKNFSSSHSSKLDSGLESEEYSHSDEDSNKENLIVELSSTPNSEVTAKSAEPERPTEEAFLSHSLAYILPAYTHNILDDVLAFTFHVKNTDPDSVQVRNIDNKIFMKFTSVGAGFVPVHYAAIIAFDSDVKFDNATGEAWDNNVILQLEYSGNVPQKFEIGIDTDSMKCEYFNESQVKPAEKSEKMGKNEEETRDPVVEVSNFGNATNIVVSSSPSHSDYDEDDDSPTEAERNIVWTESERSETGAKSILRKPRMRSYSESSVGEVASSMDYISSDCIPEESSLKKTVRFSNIIAKQFYRYNSSIEGQKKKNQRKKSKKRSLERRKSESEAEDDVSVKSSKPRMKSATKPRRDSGLADTSDAEDYKTCSREPSIDSDSDKYPNKSINNAEKQSVLNIVNTNKVEEKPPTIWESETQKTKREPKKPCDIMVKHNTDLYNPDKLNKGQYQEVNFKNDLIFDLDM